MERTIKDSVKKIFASHTFEEALELTRFLRGDYIGEFGAKSWNGLVSYWKAQNVQPAAIVASEPVEAYDEEAEETSESIEETVGVEIPIEEDDEPEMEESIADDTIESVPSSPNDETEEIEYMLYCNSVDKGEWYGHSENFRHLPVGYEGNMIRMNNCGVGIGRVVASQRMSYDHVALFHRCYATIRKMRMTDSNRVDMMAAVLNNIVRVFPDVNAAPKRGVQLVDQIIKTQNL